VRFSITVAMCPPEHVLPLARQAEACGLDGVAVPDSVFYPEKVSAPYPYTPDGRRFWGPETPWVDPWVAIPAMAAVTSRLRLYTNVLKLAIRHPLLVAKTVGSAAALAPGRIALGVGLGWIPEEFAWCGQEYATRGRRADEAIEVIRRCLAGGMVEHHGRFYDFDRLQMSPAPSEPVPILVGGLSEPALRRAARLGDGWISVVNTDEELRRIVDRLARLRAEAGRADAPFEVVAVGAEARDADGFARLAEIGATEALTMPWLLYGEDPDSLDGKLRGIERFARDVVEPLRS
jgi:probable F420-dependent oxidoreductase